MGRYHTQLRRLCVRFSEYTVNPLVIQMLNDAWTNPHPQDLWSLREEIVSMKRLIMRYRSELPLPTEIRDRTEKLLSYTPSLRRKNFYSYYNGVSYSKTLRRWKAKLWIIETKKHIEKYADDVHDAARKYDALVDQYYPEKVWMKNFDPRYDPTP